MTGDKKEVSCSYEPWNPVVTKDDWMNIEKKLTLTNPIRLQIDSYKVTLHLVKLKMKIVIVPFINGVYDVAKWELGNCEIAGKFFQEKESWLYPKKARDLAVKRWGKRAAKKHGILNKYKYTQYHWTSFAAMKRHFCKTCRSIRVRTTDLMTEFPLQRILEADNG